MIGGRALAASSRERRRRVPEPQLGDLGERRRQRVELERPDRLELLVRRARRAHEVRLVGVREPVGVARASRRRTACSSSRERRVPRAGEREQVGDRLVALRVGDRVRRGARRRASATSSRAAISAMNRAPSTRLARSSRCGSRGPESEPPPSSAPRRYAPRQHERPTTRFGGRSSGAPDAESTPASRRTASARRVDVDVQLVARRPVERVAAVGADLRADAEVAQQRERAPRRGGAREVEVDGERRRRAGARRRPRGRAPRARRAGSSAARGAICASSSRSSSRAQATRLERQQAPLVVDAERRRSEPMPPAPTTRWHGHERRERAARAERPGGARGARAARERGELAVGDDLAARDRPQRARAVAVEAVVGSSSSTSAKSSGSPGEERGQPSPPGHVERGRAVRRTCPPRAWAAREWKTRPRSSSQSSPTPQPGASY